MLNRNERLEIAKSIVMDNKKNTLSRIIMEKERNKELLQSMRSPIRQIDLNQI